MTFQKFLKLLIDDNNHHGQTEHEQHGSYYTLRQNQLDQVVRKIDNLPKEQEMTLCNFFLLLIHLKQDAEFFREQLKGSEDFNLVSLFKELCFTDQRLCCKEIKQEDFQRFFYQ